VIDVFQVLLFALIGFATGILSGLFGIGGGVVFVPVLFILFPGIGIPTDKVTLFVIATSLFAGSFASISSFINHLKAKHIEKSHALYLSLGALLSALIVPTYADSINGFYLKLLIIIVLLFASIKIYFQKNNAAENQIKNNLYKFVLFPTGIIIGGISSLTGLGGGIFYVPLLLSAWQLNVKNSIGTSSMVVFITMIAATISYIFSSYHLNIFENSLGYIYLPAGFLLGLSAIPGAWLGVKFIKKSRESIIKRIFSVFLLLAVIKIILEL